MSIERDYLVRGTAAGNSVRFFCQPLQVTWSRKLNSVIVYHQLPVLPWEGY